MVLVKRIFRKIKRILRRVKGILRTILTFNGLIHDLFGKYHCSVCERAVIHFRPLSSYYFENFKKYGYKIELAETCNRDQYKCLHCGSSDRERLYAIYIRQFTGKQLEVDSKTVFNMLHLAPTERFASFIKSELSTRPNFHYRTADLFRDWVDDKVDIVDMDIYKGGQFDFFICSHVLEHVRDDRKALRELYRILKEGGRGILMVPIDLSCEEIDEYPNCTDIAERWRRFGQGDHVQKIRNKGLLTAL